MPPLVVCSVGPPFEIYDSGQASHLIGVDKSCVLGISNYRAGLHADGTDGSLVWSRGGCTGRPAAFYYPLLSLLRHIALLVSS